MRVLVDTSGVNESAGLYVSRDGGDGRLIYGSAGEACAIYFEGW